LDDVDADVLSDDLPLIGPGLAKAAHFLSDLKNDFVSAMNTVADTLDSVGPAIYAEFGPKPGLDWLQPIQGDTHTGWQHYVVFTATLGGGQFYIHLKNDLATVSLPLAADLGIPGLGLNVAGNFALKLGWDLQLGFGVNTSEGFFIDSSKYDATANPY